MGLNVVLQLLAHSLRRRHPSLRKRLLHLRLLLLLLLLLHHLLLSRHRHAHLLHVRWLLLILLLPQSLLSLPFRQQLLQLTDLQLVF